MIGTSVIWTPGNILGKQPGTWFLGRGPAPRNHATKLRRTQMEGKLLKMLSQSSCLLLSSKEARLAIPAAQTMIHGPNAHQLNKYLLSTDGPGLCKGTGAIQMCQSWGPAFKRLNPEGRRPSSACVAGAGMQYELGTWCAPTEKAVFDLTWK